VSYIEQSLSAGEGVGGLFKLHWFAWLPMVMWIIFGIPTLGLTWLIALYEFFDPMSVKRQIESVSNPVG